MFEYEDKKAERAGEYDTSSKELAGIKR